MDLDQILKTLQEKNNTQSFQMYLPKWTICSSVKQVQQIKISNFHSMFSNHNVIKLEISNKENKKMTTHYPF